MDSIVQVTLNEAIAQNNAQPLRVGIGIIVQHEEKVLLAKRRSLLGEGSWSFPGGKLKFLESPENCVRRELYQETGLGAKKILHGPWSNDIIGYDRHYVTLFMLVPEIEGELINNQWQWFAWNALPEPLFLPLKTLIEKEGLEVLRML